jgi:hypothetical protein
MGVAQTGLKPHVAKAARDIAAKFNVKDIGGFATSGHVPGSYHYRGLALDVMVYNDKAKGDMVFEWAKANWKALGLAEIIWYRTYWDSPTHSEPYTGTSPHTDHVHLSFNDTPGSGATVDAGGSAGGLDDREGCLSVLKQIVGL